MEYARGSVSDKSDEKELHPAMIHIACLGMTGNDLHPLPRTNVDHPNRSRTRPSILEALKVIGNYPVASLTNFQFEFRSTNNFQHLSTPVRGSN